MKDYKMKQLMKWQQEDIKLDMEHHFGRDFTSEQVIEHLALRIARLESFVDEMANDNNKRHTSALKLLMKAFDRMDLMSHSIKSVNDLIIGIRHWLSGMRM